MRTKLIFNPSAGATRGSPGPRYLRLTFVAENPPHSQVFEQVARMVAEEGGEYEKRVISRGEMVCLCLGSFSVVRTGHPGRRTLSWVFLGS